jgi:hypothetical protein
MAILLESPQLSTKPVAREAERCAQKQRRKLESAMEDARFLLAVASFRLLDEAKAASLDAATPDSAGVNEPPAKVRTGGD